MSRGLAIALAAAALAASPAAAAKRDPGKPPVQAQIESSDDASYADPARALGANSPSCRYALDARGRRNCRATGSAIHSHPLSSYGLDVRVGFSITDPGKSFLGALQSIGAGVWMGVLYLVKGVLLLLEWSFSLDLTNEGMPQASRSLRRLHELAFGDPWLLLGITITGLWGMWRGLVQRKAAETIAGVGATVALMVAALALISEPQATIGTAARVANEAGLSVLAAATTGDTSHPRQGLTNSLAGVFTTTVQGPWCALEFGSAEFCDERTGDLARPTVADVWLEYPAQSWQRDHLRRLTKGEDENPSGGFLDSAAGLIGLGGTDHHLPADVKRLVRKAPDRARMQEAGGTFPRLALLGMAAVGMLGAVALYAYLGVRLLLSAAMSLLLLLLAPPMLIAPAFGDGGRATFLAWAKRLIGALLAKLVYAIFLAVVLADSAAFSHLDIGWFGTWLLLGGFWWGVFIKRHEVIAFVSAGVPRSSGDGIGHALAHGYYAWQLGRGIRQVSARASVGPRRAAAGALAQRAETRTARTAAVAGLAREQLDTRTHKELRERHARAQDAVVRGATLRRELRAVDRRLQGFDEAVAAARARETDPPSPSADQQALLRHRRRLRAALEADDIRTAPEVLRHTDRNRAQHGSPVSERDLEVRRRELLASSSDRDRELAAAATGDPAAVRSIRRSFDPAAIRQRTAEERARRREERRRDRMRQGVFRPR